MRELAHIATSDIGEVFEGLGWGHLVERIPEHARRAIASVKVKRYVEGRGDDSREVEVIEFRLWNKPQANDLLGRRHGLWVQRHEVTGRDGAPLDSRPSDLVDRLRAEEQDRAGLREAVEWYLGELAKRGSQAPPLTH